MKEQSLKLKRQEFAENAKMPNQNMIRLKILFTKMIYTAQTESKKNKIKLRKNMKSMKKK